MENDTNKILEELQTATGLEWRYQDIRNVFLHTGSFDGKSRIEVFPRDPVGWSWEICSLPMSKDKGEVLHVKGQKTHTSPVQAALAIFDLDPDRLAKGLSTRLLQVCSKVNIKPAYPPYPPPTYPAGTRYGLISRENLRDKE